MNHRAKQHPVKEWLNAHANVIAYAGLAFAIALAFFLNSQNLKNDERIRCQAGVDTRTAQRSLVEAVYNLATGSIQRKSDAPPLSKKQLEQYNDFIERSNKFRESQYKLIRPSAICRKYVKDDNVAPPTPPIPPLVPKGERKNG